MLVFAFNGSMPLREMIPEATFNCLFSLSFLSPFKKKKGPPFWNYLLPFVICQIKDMHIERSTWVEFMHLHGSEILVSRAFEASHSKIKWRYADLPLHTSLQCKTVGIQCLNIIYFIICLLKDVRLGCTRSCRAKPLIWLCFDTLDVNQSSSNKVCYSSRIFTGVLGSEINSASSASTRLADKRKTTYLWSESSIYWSLVPHFSMFKFIKSRFKFITQTATMAVNSMNQVTLLP